MTPVFKGWQRFAATALPGGYEMAALPLPVVLSIPHGGMAIPEEEVRINTPFSGGHKYLSKSFVM
jgi:hypothetical protein